MEFQQARGNPLCSWKNSLICSVDLNLEKMKLMMQKHL